MLIFIVLQSLLLYITVSVYLTTLFDFEQ